MVKTGMPARYMVMAAPLLTECRPSWFGGNPSFLGPRVEAAKLRHFSSYCPENRCIVEFLCRNVLMGVSGLEDG
jgi:hypothetical protein